MKTLAQATLVAFFAASLSACLDTGSSATGSTYSVDNDFEQHSQSQGGAVVAKLSPVRVAFDPTNQVIPFPNNLLFEAGATNPSELDGTLNVPIDDPESASANVAKGLNDLDGFSTVESWRLGFTGAIDPASLKIGETVRIFELAEAADSFPARLRPTSVTRELTDQDMQIQYDSKNFVLYLQPKVALKANRTYSALIMKGIKDPAGLLVDTPIPALIAKDTDKLGLENGQATACDGIKDDVVMLQCITYFGLNPVLQHSAAKVRAENVLLSWSVTTAREDRAFTALAQKIVAGDIKPSIPSGMTCNKAICFLDVGSLSGKDPAKTPGGKATVFPGTIRLPIMTADAKAVLDNSGSFLTGKGLFNREEGAKLTSGNWLCDGGGTGVSCNTDMAHAHNYLPKVQGWVTHPIVLAIPSSCPTGGCPVAIFAHAIQQDRTNALAIADKLAEQGVAVVAIDMPLHGMVKERLTNSAKDQSRSALYGPSLNDALYNSTLSAARNIIPLMLERTFYLDMVSDSGELNEDGSTKSDNEVDMSGAHFLNPSLPLTQRDILRQGSLDLVVLANYLRTGNYLRCGMNGLLKTCNVSDKSAGFDKLNFQNLHFISHSVGSIPAAAFLAFDQQIQTVSLLAPAGATLRTLEGSPVIGKKLSDGLAAKGVLPGTEDYYRFFASVQAAIDGVEPLNHANQLRTRRNAADESEARPIYMAIIGGDPAEPSTQDQVLPFVIKGQPLAGSQAFAKALGLTAASAQWDNTTLGDGSSALQTRMNFKRGDHASFLLPKEEVRAKKELEEGRTVTLDEIFVGEDVHPEMQRQVANFIKHKGQQLTDIKLSDVQ